ncbi:MAG: hypothetical protein HDS08_05530 [Bacteroides sp.]|nr:hypothetical protein [Bacteroides sp.]
MEAFLDLVADAYLTAERDRLSEYCFVFPNKRSGAFFARALMKNHAEQQRDSQGDRGGMFIMPDIKTVSEFVTGFSSLVEATRYEQLFVLYNEYKKLSAEIADFDKFLFWGEMLISDFNDVDRYLVDPRSLFTNVRDLKEINSTYLTEEQLAIVRRFWGDDQPHKFVEEFWTHVSHGEEGKDHRSQQKFLKLWEILYPLFTGFKAELRKRGLSTSGMYYRHAVDYLTTVSEAELPYRRYIFVGFNVLSTSELKIFRTLQRMEVADFYWDYNSPAFALPHNRATRFISANVKEFPSRYNIGEQEQRGFPEIDIIGVPSESGQAKMAGTVISRWVNDGIITDPSNAIDTAVVLPDEGMFIPVMHSVPTSISKLNITMGLPLRSTPLASVLRSITSMQLRARKVQGLIHFFYDDVRSLLSQPLIRALSPKDCEDILKDIRINRRFTIPARQLADTYPRLRPLFEPVKDGNTLESTYAYLHTLIDYLIDAQGLELGKNVASDADGEVPAVTPRNSEEDIRLRVHFLQTCAAALDSLYEAASGYKIEMRHGTFFHLVERALGGETVNFVGEPLEGLQVMGVLETRSLDFRNIIMLSMNERVFPRKQYTASFIPDTLRRGFGMATMDFQESIFAYYFYRLMSRAERVTLLYDARRVGGKSTEMSRYLSQLLYVYNAEGQIRHSLGVYDGSYFEPRQLSIPKSEAVMKKLARFTSEDKEDRKWLSASALNAYFDCPLKFYLQYVEGYGEEKDVTEYMDSSTFGTIVHAVAERIYKSLGNRDIPADSDKDLNIVITAEKLRAYLDKTDTRLGRFVTEAVNEHYSKAKEKDRNNTLKGESMVLGKIIEKCMRDMLRYEAENNEIFTFVQGEKKVKTRYVVSPSLTVNVKLIIDRIDRLSNGNLRFIDYKTGGDALSTPSIVNTLNGGASKRDKAIFQLLFYANIFSAETGYSGAIQPMIYAFRRMAVDRGIPPVRINGVEIEDYRTVNEGFVPLMNSRIAEIFDPQLNFTQTDDTKACKYCQFKPICGRVVE